MFLPCQLILYIETRFPISSFSLSKLRIAELKKPTKQIKKRTVACITAFKDRLNVKHNEQETVDGSNCWSAGNASNEGNGRLIEAITFCLVSISNVERLSNRKQEASLNVHPSSVPGDVSHVVIQSCRSVVFHESGLKNLHRLSILTVIDVGEVVFHPGSFNQFNVKIISKFSLFVFRDASQD